MWDNLSDPEWLIDTTKGLIGLLEEIDIDSTLKQHIVVVFNQCGMRMKEMGVMISRSESPDQTNKIKQKIYDIGKILARFMGVMVHFTHKNKERSVRDIYSLLKHFKILLGV